MRGRLLVALLLAAAPLHAQDGVTVDRFDAAIGVMKNADIDVTEKVTFTFTAHRNGIYRTIPIEYRTPQGFNWSIGVTFLGATDGDGNVLRVEQGRTGHYLKLKIWVPGAENATKTITIHYRASNALRFFDDHDELYWNATGDEWDYPLGLVSAVVTLPPGARGLRTAAFSGAFGSASREVVIDTTGGRITFTMPRKLEYHEGMTVVVGWNKGLVRAPTFADKALAFLRDNWPVGLPIPVLLLMYFLWYTRGRDPRARPIVVQYEPPQGMTPGEAGTLTDESVDMRDITATMVDLAVRGYLKITEQDKGTFIGISLGKGYTLTRLRAPDAALSPHEQRVMSGIFDGSSQVELEELKNEFYREIPGIRSAVFDILVRKGFYRARPDRVRNAWRVGGVVLGGAFLFFGSAIAGGLQMTPLPFIVGGVLSALIIIGFGHLMPARTEAGARMVEQVLGYGEFLQRVDSDRFARVVKTPEMFERGLPYAMALGVEGHWARAFDGIYTTPPTWYVGAYPGHFSTIGFTNSLASMSHAASATMSSQPRTSSGSGFGGGGFSGGGGGGGGGGSF